MREARAQQAQAQEQRDNTAGRKVSSRPGRRFTLVGPKGSCTIAGQRLIYPRHRQPLRHIQPQQEHRVD